MHALHLLLTNKREKERYIVYKEEKEIYILQEIDVCCLVPFLFSFTSTNLSIFVFIPLSNVNISVCGPVLVLFLLFSPDAGAIDDIICVLQKRVLEMISQINTRPHLNSHLIVLVH